MAARWVDWGVRSLTRRLVAIDEADDATTVRAIWTTAAGIEIPHTQVLSAGVSGRIRVTEIVEVPAVLDDLPRVGTLLTLTPGHESVLYYGTGPHETYPDRARGGQVGRWMSSVADQLVPYVRPQENGGHTGVSWLTLKGAVGAGVTITLDQPRQVCVLHVTAADLDTATHDVEVRARAETFVTIDSVHRGVGSASCGPDTLAPYLVPTGTHSWTWTLEPLETDTP
jgi:beta-galactosidase